MSTDPGSLSGLHDIVPASASSWWPLAPGWYFLGLLLALLAAWWAYRRWRRYRLNRYRRTALAELRAIEQAQDPGAIQALPALLKRTAMQAWQRESVAALSREAWCAFLDSHCPGEPFSGAAGDALVALSYRPVAMTPEERGDLIESSRTWIRKHRVEPC